MFITKETKRTEEIVTKSKNGAIMSINLFFGTTRKELLGKRVGELIYVPSFYRMCFTKYGFPVYVYSDKPYENIKVVVEDYMKNERWKEHEFKIAMKGE